MKNIRLAFRCIVFASFAGLCAQAAVIADFTDTLSATDPTQSGRLSRNGDAQDWTGFEVFPGVINSGTSYHYRTYSFNVGITNFIQIDVDSISGNTFVSAYLGGYLPDSAGSPDFGFDTNWLGDAGSSGNTLGVNPIFFQVVTNPGDTLLVVVNQTATGSAGLGDPFHITVEGFIDTEFSDPAATPEPAAIILGASGLAFLGFVRRFRRANA